MQTAESFLQKHFTEERGYLQVFINKFSPFLVSGKLMVFSVELANQMSVSLIYDSFAYLF